jgi:hypothetical protein
VNFLLDTNILIPAEPTSRAEIEPTTSAIVELISVLAEGGHRAFVHPASVEEIRGDKDEARAKARELLLRKYQQLPHPPAMNTRLLAVLGTPKASSNSEIDLLLLSSVEANAIDYFITEDDKLHRRAKRVDLRDRVLTIADAILMVRALFPTVPKAPPFVSPLLAHQLDETDPIFVSFRSDYPGFDAWLAKCKREHRQTWIIKASAGYAAICIVNHETPNGYGFPGKTLKICSFKIADRFQGFRYGELILKTVFAYLVENHYRGVQRWKYVDFDHGTLASFKTKTGGAQYFVADRGLMALLEAWHESLGKPSDDQPIIPKSMIGCEVKKLAEVLRDDLKAVGVTRPILFEENEPNVEPLRFRDLRSTFCTWARRQGRSDAWISERTGQEVTGDMISRYDKGAVMLSDLQYVPFPDISRAIPELADVRLHNRLHKAATEAVDANTGTAMDPPTSSVGAIGFEPTTPTVSREGAGVTGRFAS